MTVYQDGYTCHECGPVKAKLVYDNKNGETLAVCTKCGQTIQAVIPAPISKLQWIKGYVETIDRKNSTPLVGGGPRPERHACIPNSGESFSPRREPSQAAPAHPQEDKV